ncbi:hypothetical protein BC829DRAFT_423985 [Chytridium lagenaria]|nr:hypothetical protein BC829DRAFT_423985 [Chytridium lagenaria]
MRRERGGDGGFQFSNSSVTRFEILLHPSESILERLELMVEVGGDGGQFVRGWGWSVRVCGVAGGGVKKKELSDLEGCSVMELDARGDGSEVDNEVDEERRVEAGSTEESEAAGRAAGGAGGGGEGEMLQMRRRSWMGDQVAASIGGVESASTSQIGSFKAKYAGGCRNGPDAANLMAFGAFNEVFVQTPPFLELKRRKIVIRDDRNERGSGCRLAAKRAKGRWARWGR